MVFKNLLENEIAIVTSNFPILLYIDIYKYLENKYGGLSDIQNLFIRQEIFSKPQYYDDFREICVVNEELNVFIDCTKGIQDYIKNKPNNMDFNFVFVVSNQDHCEELAKKCKLTPTKFEMNYNWTDLNKATQERLLQTKITFQNNSVPLGDLLSSEAEELLAILSENILNLLLEEKHISVNTGVNFTTIDKKFNILFRNRNLKKYTKNFEDIESDENEDESKIPSEQLTQEQMLTNFIGIHYMLISDIAGTGKSWLLRNMAKQCQARYPNKWTTFVDLKMYKEAFNRQIIQPEFACFMIENIMKLKDDVEIKIFRELYKNGKVIIFFDGFDEISKYYAEIVKKLIKAYVHNGGNQMWISTRQQFEVDLQRDLRLNFTFGFDNFTIVDGRNLMAYSWIIWEEGYNIDDEADLENIVKNSLKLDTYLENAKKLISDSRNNLRKSIVIGMPALYEIMAKFFKDKKVLPKEKNINDFYNEFESLLIKRSKTIKTP